MPIFRWKTPDTMNRNRASVPARPAPRRRWLLPLGLLVLLAGSAPAAEHEPEVLAELARQRIYEGETVEYQVILNHVASPQPPQLDGLDENFQIESLGENSLDSRQITIINGRMTEVVRYGRAYRYALTPKRSGTLEIPAPTAEIDGQLYSGPALTLVVVPPTEQDLAMVEIHADRQHVYPLQPFEIRCTIAVASLPEPVAERNPVTALRRLPALSIPWAIDDSLPAGVRPDQSWQEWIEPLRSRRGGFSINNIGSRSVFSLFDDGPLGFLPEPRRTTRKDSNGREAPYWEFDFVRRFTASEPGTLAFGPVTLKGGFVTAVSDDGVADTEDVFAVAKPCTVVVREPPVADRPESYVQAIGKFTLAASLVPPEAKVGDPLTLTLTLHGEGTLDAARAPDLAKHPEVAERFRVYEASEETRGEARRFTYSLRPLQAGRTAFPSIPLSYFDVERERYVTLQTPALPLVVTEAERIEETEIAVAPGTRGGRAIEVQQDGILGNTDDLAALQDQSVRPRGWLAYVSLLGVIYVGVVVASRYLGRYLGDAAWQRRRAAPGRARQRLQAACTEIRAGRQREGAEQLGAAVTGLVADLAGRTAAGMTSREVERQLAAWKVADELRQQVASLLETCDGARYGGSSAAVEALGDSAPALVEALIRALKGDKR